ncbi:unnamed protein product [Auanema sp. JU1783]|nr:unnamed protein product [Auanema sp. JU1783]
MVLCLFVLLLYAPIAQSLPFTIWLPPFNESRHIYQLCNNEMDNIILLSNNTQVIDYFIQKYVLCYSDYEVFVPLKYQPLVWVMRALRFCEVNQIFQYNKHRTQFHREFQKQFLRYSYAAICDRGALLKTTEKMSYYVYSSLFNILYLAQSPEREHVCNSISQVYTDLYSRCYVPHVAKRQQKIQERCSSATAPLLKFRSFFQRFSRDCDTFGEFVNRSAWSVHNMGRALANDTVFMNLLSSDLYSNIHSDSQLPSLVLRTRLLLQHFSLAAVKLWKQVDEFRKCRSNVISQERYINETDDDGHSRLSQTVSSICCNSNSNHICELQNEKRFRILSDQASIGFRIEFALLAMVCFNTALLAILLLRTSRSLSTATVLFVLNIMFSNLLFLLSFAFFFSDLLQDSSYGDVNDDHFDKSAELIIAETLQTHLFDSSSFRKYLIQETLYSLSQNGSLIGLIHLLVLVLIVINRSMAGSSVHISKIAVVSLFAGVWIVLIVTHVMFSTMQISAIRHLDELFATLIKGRVYLNCGTIPRSGYEEIAGQCDRTAVFHMFGAYLLRGHTLFTLFFLTASIVIFTVTITYHIKVHRDCDLAHSGLREQSPHRRRERLFHTLILSITTFFISVLGQTYIEIAVFWVNDREDVARLTKWYHYARIAAYVDPLLNPLIVVARTPALRRHLRAQWTSVRSHASSRVRSLGGSRKFQRGTSLDSAQRSDVEVKLCRTDRPCSTIRRDTSHRRSGDSQTHNSVV